MTKSNLSPRGYVNKEEKWKSLYAAVQARIGLVNIQTEALLIRKVLQLGKLGQFAADRLSIGLVNPDLQAAKIGNPASGRITLVSAVWRCLNRMMSD